MYDTKSCIWADVCFDIWNINNLFDIIHVSILASILLDTQFDMLHIVRRQEPCHTCPEIVCVCVDVI